MRIILHKNFEKRLKKLSRPVQQAFKRRRDLFLQNPSHRLLNNHPLRGVYLGFRSINITGDYRVVYDFLEPDLAHFLKIGTHTELYE